ncbi:MAG: hypothetical protein Q9191_006636 [Dirinaria sp. TL-2023a]
MAPALASLDQQRMAMVTARQRIQPRHSAAQRNEGSRIPVRIIKTRSQILKEALAAQRRRIKAVKEKVERVLHAIEARPAAQQVVREELPTPAEGAPVSARLQVLNEWLSRKIKEPLPWVEPHLGRSEVPLGRPGETSGLPLPNRQKESGKEAGGKKAAGKKRVGFAATSTVCEGLPRWDKSCIDPESQKVNPTAWD